MKKAAAEFLGTFVLVFFGTGAIVVGSAFPGAITHLGVSAAFGIAVAAMIYAFGHVSGAHINPAATAALVLAGRHPAKEMLPYLAAQLAGAMAASALLRLLFPGDALLGATLPAAGIVPSTVIEFIMTFVLLLSVLKAAEREAHAHLAGFVIGAVVMLEALVGGPISGASMNPARSIAPALVSGHLENLWIYIVSPLAVGASAALVQRWFASPAPAAVPLR